MRSVLRFATATTIPSIGFRQLGPMRLSLTLTVALHISCVQAQSYAFPDGATPLEETALLQRFSGKTFRLRSPSGQDTSFEFGQGGTAWLDGPNFNFHGPWHVEGSKICVAWVEWKSGCYEVREAGRHVFYRKLSDGTVAELEAEESSSSLMNPYSGTWRMTHPGWADAEVVIDGKVGTLYFFASGYGRTNNACLRLKHPVRVIRFSDAELVLFVNSSAALPGCDDFRFALQRIDDSTLAGGEFRMVRK